MVLQNMIQKIKVDFTQVILASLYISISHNWNADIGYRYSSTFITSVDPHFAIKCQKAKQFNCDI